MFRLQQFPDIFIEHATLRCQGRVDEEISCMLKHDRLFKIHPFLTAWKGLIAVVDCCDCLMILVFSQSLVVFVAVHT